MPNAVTGFLTYEELATILTPEQAEALTNPPLLTEESDLAQYSDRDLLASTVYETFLAAALGGLDDLNLVAHGIAALLVGEGFSR